MSDQWTVAIRDEFGRVLCVEPNGQGVVEFREAAGAWETFRVTEQPPDWQPIFLFRDGAFRALTVDVL